MIVLVPSIVFENPSPIFEKLPFCLRFESFLVVINRKVLIVQETLYTDQARRRWDGNYA